MCLCACVCERKCVSVCVCERERWFYTRFRDYIWDMPSIWDIDSCLGWVMSHYEWVMSHVWMSHNIWKQSWTGVISQIITCSFDDDTWIIIHLKTHISIYNYQMTDNSYFEREGYRSLERGDIWGIMNDTSKWLITRILREKGTALLREGIPEVLWKSLESEFITRILREGCRPLERGDTWGIMYDTWKWIDN